MNQQLAIGVLVAIIFIGGGYAYLQGYFPSGKASLQTSTTTPETQVGTQKSEEEQSSKQTQPVIKAGLVITNPAIGDILSRNQKVEVKWIVSPSLLNSVPSDFDSYVFIYVRKQNDVQGAPNSASVGDGNPASDGVATWDIAHARWNSSSTSIVPLDPGTYEMRAHFQVQVKDMSRACAKSYGKDCAPDDAAAAVYERFAGIDSETIIFQIK